MLDLLSSNFDFTLSDLDHRLIASSLRPLATLPNAVSPAPPRLSSEHSPTAKRSPIANAGFLA